MGNSRTRATSRGPRRTHPIAALWRLAWRADKGGLSAMVGATIFDAAAALGGTLAVGFLLNALVSNGGVVDHTAWVALAVVGAIFLIQRVAFPFLGPAIENLEHRLTLLVRERVMAPLLRPSTISHLEDPVIADELRQAQQVGSENFSAQQALQAFTQLGGARLAAVGSAVLLGRWRWWAPAVLAAAWLFSRVWYKIQMGTLVASMERSTPALRQAEYVGELVLGGTAAKESRVFGLAPFLTRRFESRWRAGMVDVWRQRRRGRIGTVLNTAIILGAHLLVIGLLVREALALGPMFLGDLFIYLQAAFGMAGLGFQPENEYILRMGAAPLPHVLVLDDLVAESEAGAPAGTRPVGRSPRDAIRLEHVWFGYPTSDRPVLEDINLEIPAGTSIAFVGENGAGKTSLVNLICGFYRPVAGRLTVDGVDLAEFDPTAWQHHIGAVFQEYARYALTLRENIVFGGGKANWEARYRAAEKAGLHDLAQGLPRNWFTTLSREFEGGTDLSGGQWQRVALARALFALEAGARVLVLDEPTANLDVRSEAALYNRFLELTAGLTTIIVSHRFSTVRRADRIVVLDAGRIVESGTHDELLARRGRYARMFSLQARHYQAPTPPPHGRAVRPRAPRIGTRA